MSESVRGEVSSVGRDVASSRAEWEPAAAAAAAPGRKHMSAFVWSPWRRNLPVCKSVTPAQLTGGEGEEGGGREAWGDTHFFLIFFPLHTSEVWRCSYVVYRESGVYFSSAQPGVLPLFTFFHCEHCG